jgi:enoyl-CoA hydratase
MSADGRIRLVREHAIATLWFDRPASRNAMTTEMYRQFEEACTALQSDEDLRFVVLRGVGGKAFIAGTDISRFLDFTSAEDGIAYEREMERHLASLSAIPVPVLAVIEEWAVGGGLSIAAGCDLRIATPGARFGVPIARTVGNCLAMSSYARLVAGFGEGRTKRMLLLGEMILADEALASGFLARIVEPAGIDAAVAEIAEKVVAGAPISLRVSKLALQRLAEASPDGDDLIRLAYGSEDFGTGVRAFLGKTKPKWKGR